MKGTRYEERDSLQKYATNTHNLNIHRYVEPKVASDVLTVEEVMQRPSDSAEAAFAAEERLVSLLNQENLLVGKSK